MKSLEVIATVQGGKLVGFNRGYFARMLSLFEGKKIVLKVERATKKRSNYQNRYYWGVVVPIILEALQKLGHDELNADDVHDFLKARFNSEKVVNKKTGEVMEIPKSTIDLNTIDFMDFMDNIKRFASESLDCYIPDPNEQGTLIFDRHG